MKLISVLYTEFIFTLAYTSLSTSFIISPSPFENSVGAECVHANIDDKAQATVHLPKPLVQQRR